MPVYVVDASVGIKWFLPEERTDAAERLLVGHHRLLVPDSFFPEVANILWKHVQRNAITQEEARRVVSRLADFPLAVFPSPPIMMAALEIAMQTGRTAYDSIYIALAVRENVPLVTADERLVNALASGPLGSRLVFVADVLHNSG